MAASKLHAVLSATAEAMEESMGVRIRRGADSSRSVVRRFGNTSSGIGDRRAIASTTRPFRQNRELP